MAHCNFNKFKFQEYLIIQPEKTERQKDRKTDRHTTNKYRKYSRTIKTGQIRKDRHTDREDQHTHRKDRHTDR